MRKRKHGRMHHTPRATGLLPAVIRERRKRARRERAEAHALAERNAGRL